jgi:hypothetical protein
LRRWTLVWFGCFTDCRPDSVIIEEGCLVDWKRLVRWPVLALALAVAATAMAWTGGAFAASAGRLSPATSFSTKGVLTGVAATSAGNAWAVGLAYASDGTSTVILHWNGHSWKRQASPGNGGGSALDAVAAVSARDAWAVGTDSKFNDMVLHWNGSSWKRVAAPRPGVGSMLTGIVAMSAHDILAVGSDSPTDESIQPLILRFNGSVWKRVAGVPDADEAQLSGVTATSARNAWAVGVSLAIRTVILHWNGSSWKRVASPSPTFGGGGGGLTGVAAPSKRLAFAVGTAGFSSGSLGVLLRWNGSRWVRVSRPNLTLDSLPAVAATSSRNAWAVGGAVTRVLILHWNGTSWKKVTGVGTSGGLDAVAATSATNAWAVGSTGRNGKLLILHWNGRRWQ